MWQGPTSLGSKGALVSGFGGKGMRVPGQRVDGGLLPSALMLSLAPFTTDVWLLWSGSQSPKMSPFTLA